MVNVGDVAVGTTFYRIRHDLEKKKHFLRYEDETTIRRPQPIRLLFCQVILKRSRCKGHFKIYDHPYDPHYSNYSD